MRVIKKVTSVQGCFELHATVHKDARGSFIKLFHAPAFRKMGLNSEFSEDYYSVSKKGVLRGLHFQSPPDEHDKLVCCLEGEVFDAVLDLRKGSRTFGGAFTTRLSAKKANLLYVPAGCAHGFFALSRALMLYKTSTVHSPERDSGVLWSSAGIKWPCKKPLISPRDAGFAALKDFRSPF